MVLSYFVSLMIKLIIFQTKIMVFYKIIYRDEFVSMKSIIQLIEILLYAKVGVRTPYSLTKKVSLYEE
jgi:hypothetical protein